MLAQGTKLQNRYVVRRQLGQGGMGAVYEATDERFGTPVALKEIVFATTDEEQQRYLAAAFAREAKALATIQHECIPFVRDYFSEEANEYLVMELVAGDDLGRLLDKQKKPFALYEALGWLHELLDALDYLHNLSPPIIHRDIKPQNLKVTSRKRVKLLDFGIAKSGERSAATTRKQTFIGATLDYSPFEQILRVIDASFREFIILKHEGRARAVLDQTADERADIFSAGATFYHLITGRVPEDATKRTLAVWEGQADPLPHPSEVNDQISRPIGDMLMNALEIDRGRRYETAAQMLEALNQAVLSRSVPKPTPRVEVTEIEEQSKTVEIADPSGQSSAFHAADTHAFTISKEQALAETEEFVPPATVEEQSRVSTAFLPASDEKQSTVETVSLPSSADLLAGKRQSTVKTESLPDSAELLANGATMPDAVPPEPVVVDHDYSSSPIFHNLVQPPGVEPFVLDHDYTDRPMFNMAPPPTIEPSLRPTVEPVKLDYDYTNLKPMASPRGSWLAVVAGFVIAFVALAGGAAAWLGGFIGGGTSANKTAVNTQVVAPTSPSPQIATGQPSPQPSATPASSVAIATPTPNQPAQKEIVKPVYQSPPKIDKPVTAKSPPKKAPAPKQDPNCVFTNSCH